MDVSKQLTSLGQGGGHFRIKAILSFSGILGNPSLVIVYLTGIFSILLAALGSESAALVDFEVTDEVVDDLVEVDDDDDDDDDDGDGESSSFKTFCSPSFFPYPKKPLTSSKAPPASFFGASGAISTSHSTQNLMTFGRESLGLSTMPNLVIISFSAHPKSS